MNIDIPLLRTFVRVVEKGSFRAVAAELSISPGAVSKQISRLEQIVSAQLLVRTTRSIELTEFGVSFLEQARRIIEEVRIGEALIQQLKEEPQGSLKVVSGRHFAARYITPYLKSFLARYPKIELNLELSERIPDFDAEAIDIVVGMSQPVAGNALQKQIHTTRYVYCASQDYLDIFGMPKQLSELRHHRVITHSMRTWEQEDYTPYLAVNDTETMALLAMDGVGIVKLHEYVVEKKLREGTLVELFPHESKKTLPIYSAIANRRFIPSKVRAFLDFVSINL